MILRLALLLAALVLGSCSTMQRELSDDEWCKSFEYRAGTREYAECRQRIDRSEPERPKQDESWMLTRLDWASGFRDLSPRNRSAGLAQQA
jgi:hypothetical protein